MYISPCDLGLVPVTPLPLVPSYPVPRHNGLSKRGPVRSPPYICPPRYRSPVLPQADALRPYPLTSALHCRMGSVDPAVAVRHIAPRRDALLKLRATTAPVLFPLVCLILYA